MLLETYALSVAGRRTNNEDAVCAEPELGLFVVADGMGGYEGGEVASALAVETIHSLVRRTASGGDVIWPYAIDPQRSWTENEVIVAARHAAEQIAVRRTGALREMGSTVAILRLDGEHAVVGHVGDSRVYRLRGGGLAQLTIDHSLSAELERSGVKPDAHFAWRHVVTRALGTQVAEPEVQRAPIQRGDVFLLCSDGLSEVLEPERIAALLSAPAEAACRALVEAAYVAGSRDNISAIVVRVR
jgi:serine/threonine protein phosphatase PrpC